MPEKLETRPDSGPDKVYEFLSRSGFLEATANEQQFQEWVHNLNFDDFERHLTRLNGIVRQLPIKDRKIDGDGVEISNELFGTAYLPPHAEDKRELLQKAFEGAKDLPEQDAGLLLYYSLQAIHPFTDGNGRTGRLLFSLLDQRNNNEPISKEKLQGLLAHDETDSGPGRERFEKQVISPEDAYPIIEYIVALDVLPQDITRKFERIFSAMQSGIIRIPDNKNLTDETKNALEKIMSEGGGSAYPFRNIVLLKYLTDHDLLDKYPFALNPGVAEKRKILAFDGEKVLEGVSEAGAQEMIATHARFKKLFIEKLIDTIANSTKYKMSDGKTVKDQFYAEA